MFGLDGVLGGVVQVQHRVLEDVVRDVGRVVLAPAAELQGRVAVPVPSEVHK